MTLTLTLNPCSTAQQTKQNTLFCSHVKSEIALIIEKQMFPIIIFLVYISVVITDNTAALMANSRTMAIHFGIQNAIFCIHNGIQRGLA